MTITAKYPGTCPDCHGQIQPGDQVEWTKGAKAHHTHCPQRAQSQSQPAARHESRTGSSDRPASEKQISYALRLLARMDEPLIADAFTPPTAAQVQAMSARECSDLIGMLREDEW